MYEAHNIKSTPAGAEDLAFIGQLKYVLLLQETQIWLQHHVQQAQQENKC